MSYETRLYVVAKENDMTETFKTLQEVTGHESGIVLYADSDGTISTGIIQNWSSEVGIPRISPLGNSMMSWPYDIEVVETRTLSKDEIKSLLEDLTELLNFSSASDEELETDIANAEEATLYNFKSGDKVIVFPDWA